MPLPTLQVGIDYRSALVNREGIGRYTRELVRALAAMDGGPELGLFGYTFGRRKYSNSELGIAQTKARLARLRIPSRALPWLMEKADRGADDLVGGCHVFHHTQPNLLPISSAKQMVTIFDAIYTLDAGYLEPAAAERMTQVAFQQVRRADRILVPCQFVGADIVMALGAHPSKIVVAELGCDHVLRHMPAEGFPAPKDPYLLTVSRIDPRKNHIRILQAFERLVADGFPHRWVVAGPRGWQAEIFERELDKSPARERIVRLGDVTDERLTQLYAQAEAMIFPSLNEGFGLPPLESMACGTPVVTSHVTATGELCEGAAMMVEPADVDDIYAATRKLLTEKEIYNELVDLGRERAAQYTWESCAQKTELAYRGAVKQSSPNEGRLYSSL